MDYTASMFYFAVYGVSPSIGLFRSGAFAISVNS